MFLVTDKLTKVYKKVPAVSNVDIHIKRGSIYGLIGKNGAGKTTIMKILAGLAEPTSGSFRYDGFEGKEEMAFSRIGALIEAPALHPNLSAYDNMRIKCLAYGIGDKNYISEKLSLVGLGKVGKKKAGKFSLGMRQRLGIALALVGDPDFLLLDEPINGLDPQGIAEMREILSRLNKENGITILISSHILEELAKIATQYAIIDKGHIIEESTSEELRLRCKDKIVIKTADSSSVLPILDSNGFTDYQTIDSKTIYVFERLDDVSLLNSALVMAGVAVESISVEATELEEYFLKITGNARTDYT
ncbi:MAG: ATP-binding cassette domain-containing protein [Clostridiales bacterium]|nr:ATP-binding cassette domain-containing protein [Clostridiales bacterium]